MMNKKKGKIIFILGGVKSGKTLYVINQAKKIGSSVTYLATAIAGDKEMKAKIEEHKKMRPKNWGTIEEPLDLLDRIRCLIGTSRRGRKINKKVIIIDCINFWLSNLLASGMDKKKILEKTSALCSLLREKKMHSFVISNEVGLSLVPPNRAGRQFQDLLGKINQVIANYSDEIYFLVAGIPLKLK